MIDTSNPVERLEWNMRYLERRGGHDNDFNRAMTSVFSEFETSPCLSIPFDHRPIYPAGWGYEPQLPHVAKILGCVNGLNRDLVVPSPFSRDSQTHRLVGLQRTPTSEIDGNIKGARLDIGVKASDVVFSIFTDWSRIYNDGRLSQFIVSR